MPDIAISVVMPFRDAEATLGEALASVLSQQGPSLEVIAVDDGSRDASADVVLRTGDPRVRLVRGDGAGIARALSAGVECARAAFVARMDADDVALPGRFAAQVALLESDPRLGVAGTRVEAFPEGAVGEGLRLYVEWQNSLVTPADHARDLFVESPLCHPSAMLRREALASVGGYRAGDFPEDYDLWLRLAAAGWRIAKVPAVLLRWRQREGRATFTDARYAPERFRALRAAHLAPRLRERARPVVVWGAGPTGRRLARELELHGVSTTRFVDIDPRKIGRLARGAPIVAPSSLVPGSATIVVAVGARGARALVRAHLESEGFRETDDFVCAA